jgi:hypothetical protein
METVKKPAIHFPPGLMIKKPREAPDMSGYGNRP